MTLATAAPFASIGTFATVYRTIGLTLAFLVVVAAIVYVLVNVIFSGKEEIGSEIELAANRKPYFDDETLEGPKLDRALTVGLLMLFVLAIGIPIYWIMEPAPAGERRRPVSANASLTAVSCCSPPPVTTRRR